MMIKWKVVFVVVGSVVAAFTVFLRMVVPGLIEREKASQTAKQVVKQAVTQVEQDQLHTWMKSPEYLALLKAKALRTPSCIENMETLARKHPLWSAQKGIDWVAMDWDEDKCTMGGQLKSEQEFYRNR